MYLKTSLSGSHQKGSLMKWYGLSRMRSLWIWKAEKRHVDSLSGVSSSAWLSPGAGQRAQGIFFLKNPWSAGLKLSQGNADRTDGYAKKRWDTLSMYPTIRKEALTMSDTVVGDEQGRYPQIGYPFEYITNPKTVLLPISLAKAISSGDQQRGFCCGVFRAEIPVRG